MSPEFAGFLAAMTVGIIMIFASAGTAAACVAAVAVYFVVGAMVASNKKKES